MTKKLRLVHPPASSFFITVQKDKTMGNKWNVPVLTLIKLNALLVLFIGIS
ncbi:MAG: hypothetical protein ACJAWH_000463 [Maribacter sp.]|jgi:hypothetical protein